jgi:chromatin structure-remodeling complex subunit RSC9
MLLALRSGVLSEVSWALARLLRFSLSERFVLSVWPGLVDALCDWPDWFVAHADDEGEDGNIFSPSPVYSLRRRFALTSLLILKNAAHLDENSITLSGSRRVRFLVFMTLNKFRIPSDNKHEFLLGVLEIFRLAVYKYNPPPGLDRMSPLISIIANSQDRAMIISGLYGLQNILDAFPNVRHVTPTSGSLKVAIYLLGITEDRELVLAALEYLLAHLANPTLAKAFLHHPDLSAILRLLVLQILYDQKLIAENVSLTVHSSAKDPSLFNSFELPKEEMESLTLLLEPGRASEWYVERLIFLGPLLRINQDAAHVCARP